MTVLFLYPHVKCQKYIQLFANIEHRPSNMVWLPPSVLQEPHHVQLVNAPNKPRLDLHPPFLVLSLCFVLPLGFVAVAFRAITRGAIGGKIAGSLLICDPGPLLPLSLENGGKALVPVEYVYHPTRFQVSPEQDACVRQFPHDWYFTFHVARPACTPLGNSWVRFLSGISLWV